MVRRRKDVDSDLTYQEDAFAIRIALGETNIGAHRLAFPDSKGNDNTRSVAAWGLLQRPKIKQRVAEIAALQRASVLSRVSVRTETVLQQLAWIAEADVRNLFARDGSVKPVDEWTTGEAAMVAGIETEQKNVGSREEPEFVTVTRIKLWNKPAILDMAAKHLGMYREDNMQKSGPFAGLPRDVLTALVDLLNERAQDATASAGGVHPEVEPGTGSGGLH